MALQIIFVYEIYFTNRKVVEEKKKLLAARMHLNRDASPIKTLIAAWPRRPLNHATEKPKSAFTLYHGQGCR